MLSKNSTLSLVAFLLFSNASVMIADEAAVKTQKNLVELVAVVDELTELANDSQLSAEYSQVNTEENADVDAALVEGDEAQ